MSIFFEPVKHEYKSLDSTEDIKWTSVTTMLGKFKHPFDADTIAAKQVKKKGSKYYGLSVEMVKKIWKMESTRACDLGNWYHNQREADILNCATITRHGLRLPVVAPINDAHGRKIASDQRLSEGIYPEHMVYLKSVGICGQSDLVEVADGKVYILDYKSNKKIDTEAFKSWDGISKKMLAPLQHLDDCNLNHYNLQLSIYMYIILKHNPKLKPGGLTIHHVIFEVEGEDDFGYPITKLNEQGDPIVKDIVAYDLPYLKKEVEAIFKTIKK